MREEPVVVLHIEDDDIVCQSVGSLLSSEGYRAISALDGPSAVELVKTSGIRPDVIIADYALPGEMDGTEAVQAICGALGYVVPTIVLSGELANAAVPWIPGAPLFCVWKPIDPQILLMVVGTFATLGRFLRARSRPRQRDAG